MTSANYQRKCVICDRIYDGYGHNAEPVRKGRCCDDCNWQYVIPERMRLLTGK